MNSRQALGCLGWVSLAIIVLLALAFFIVEVLPVLVLRGLQN